jgi:phosphoribosylformylglycinamidine synthase
MVIDATVTVRLKDGVLDPQGRTILRSLGQVGFPEVSHVRTGRTFDIRLNAKDRRDAEARLRAMSEKLLANPVIEAFEVTVHA